RVFLGALKRRVDRGGTRLMRLVDGVLQQDHLGIVGLERRQFLLVFAGLSRLFFRELNDQRVGTGDRFRIGVNQCVVRVLPFDASGGGVLQIGVRFRQPLERNAAGVGGGDDAFALAVLLQFAARGLDVGADR